MRKTALRPGHGVPDRPGERRDIETTAASCLTTAVISGARFTVPVGTRVVLGVIAGVLGVIAAVAPARRASKLDVIEALAFE